MEGLALAPWPSRSSAYTWRGAGRRGKCGCAWRPGAGAAGAEVALCTAAAAHLVTGVGQGSNVAAPVPAAGAKAVDQDHWWPAPSGDVLDAVAPPQPAVRAPGGWGRCCRRGGRLCRSRLRRLRPGCGAASHLPLPWRAAQLPVGRAEGGGEPGRAQGPCSGAVGGGGLGAHGDELAGRLQSCVRFYVCAQSNGRREEALTLAVLWPADLTAPCSVSSVTARATPAVGRCKL